MEVSLKPKLQAFLKRIGIYHRLKASRIYDLYWTFANPKLAKAKRTELEFYRRTLRGFKKDDLIYDIGANMGYKSQLFLQLGARVIAVEPDDTNQQILRKSFHTVRLYKKPVTIVGKAVSEKTGTETMWIDEPGSAKNTLNPKWVDTLRHDSSRFGETLAFREKRTVETTTMEDLFAKYGRPFFIKIDVEGYEASVLSGMQSPVPFVSFEVNLPEFQSEALQCIDSLERIAPGGTYNLAPDCLRGLAFDRWQSRAEFTRALHECHDPSIEVFWNAPSISLF